MGHQIGRNQKTPTPWKRRRRKKRNTTSSGVGCKRESVDKLLVEDLWTRTHVYTWVYACNRHTEIMYRAVNS